MKINRMIRWKELRHVKEGASMITCGGNWTSRTEDGGTASRTRQYAVY